MAPIDITILKVTDPSHFCAREVPGRSSTGQARQFIQLCQDIDEYCSQEHFINMHMYNPKKGMICLVKKAEREHWYRAKVNSIMLRKSLSEANCFLLDYGETVRIPMNRVREIPSQFLNLPFQAREYCLYGLVPLTLKVSFDDDMAKMLPSAKWDTAAVEYFDELLRDKPATVEIHGEREDGVLLVTLFVNGDQRQVNVNEELLRLNYATRVEEPTTLTTARIRKPDRTLVSKPTSPQSSSPALRKLEDDEAVGVFVRRRTRSHQSQEASDSSGSEAREDSRRTTLRDYLGLSPQRQDQQTVPFSPASSAGRRQDAPAQGVELSSPAENKTSGKLPSVREGAELKHLPSSSLSTSEQEMNSPKGSPDQSQDGEARGASGPVTMLPIPQKHGPSSSTRGKLLAHLQAMKEMKASGSLKDPRKRSQGQATSQPQEGPACQAKLPLPLRHQTSPISRASSVPSPVHLPTATSRPSSKSPSPAKPMPTASPGATRLPFAVDGRFSLLPEELESISPRKSPSLSKTPQSGRRKTRQSATSSDPDFYNSSSDEPTRYVTPVMTTDKVVGQRLLNQITPAGPAASPASDSDKLLYTHIKKASRVLVHGDRPPRPILHTDQSPFPDFIHRKLSQQGFPGPSDIQAHSWPVILRGTDMVGISAPGTGKSLAFLLPLITQSLQPSTYAALPPGNGPLVVIVSPRWRKAANVYDQCRKFLPSQRGSKVLVIYGAGSEEQQEVQLLNGCSILVATLPCLLRMLKGDHTSLNRLSHLVLDDANILCEQYTEKVKELMSLYSMVLRTTKTQRTAPRQLLLFSSQWSVALGSFVRSYMSNPVAIITSPLEAGVYARVRQVVRRVEPSGRDSLLGALLEAGPSEARRTIIFVNSKEQAQQLQQVLLGGFSHYTMLAFNGMPQHHLDGVKKEWHRHHRNDSLPVLVCTDGVIRDLNITDASTVVHYDFPPSKQKLGQRLSCMMERYSSQLESNTVSDCQSILLISKGHTLLVPGLINLLNRCSFAIPTQLQMEEAILEKEESKKSKSLCHQLKAFGECRNESSCTGRHHMFADADSPGCHANHIQLPPAGVVKILIMHIVDATMFYARILEYRSTEASKPVALPNTHVDLASELASWFSDPDSTVSSESPLAGDLCGYEDIHHVFHRVKVQRSKRPGSALLEEEKEVLFVDQGRVERVPVNKLLKLSDHLCSIPYQAVEIYVSCVKPFDGDTEWTTQAGFFVYDKIHDKQLEGKIVLSLDNALWLDPLVQRVHLPSIKTTVNINNVRHELLKAGYAEDNPEHIHRLRKLCTGRVPLPDMVVPSSQESRSQPMLLPDPIYLSPSDDFYSVHVSSVHTPGCLYIQLSSYAERLEKLMEEINAKLSEKTLASSRPEDWKPGQGEVCLARFHEDHRWNRVRILQSPSDGRYEVFYLDYGDVEEVEMDWLHPAWNSILMLPFQAVQCCLANISPTADQWSDAAGDALWDMCLDGDDKKLLMAKVVSEGGQVKEFRPGGSIQYDIELFDTSSERDIVIGHQLVHGGHAAGNEAFVQSIFPTRAIDDSSEPSLSTEVGNMLSQLCSELYQTENEMEQREIAVQITELLLTLSQSDCSSEVDVTPLCQLIASGRGHQEVRDSLTAGLARICFKNPKSCEVMCRNGGLKEICHLLSKTEDAELQECISYILLLSSGSAMSILEYGGIQVLCHILDNRANADIVNQASAALAALVSGNNKIQSAVNESRGLASVCKLLGSLKKEDCTLNLLRALSKMAANGGTRDEIREEGGLLVLCDLLWDTKDSRLVHIIAQTLTSLSCNNPENLEFMNEQSLMECVESQLMCMSHSESTHQLLNTLHMRLMHIQHCINEDNQSEQSYQPVRILDQSGAAVDKPPSQTSQATVPSSQSGTRQQYVSQVVSIQELKEEARREPCAEDLSDMPPLEAISDSALPRKRPRVLWSQRPNSVVLSVQLRGVMTFDLNVTSTGVSFSTVADGKVYGFSLELYGRVRAPDHAAVAHGSEVLITLYKESVGTNWSRLTASKSKLPFVGVDFERTKLEDSDSEEDIAKRFGIKKKSQPVVRPRTKSSQSGRSSNAIPIAPLPEFDTSDSSDSYSDADASFLEDDELAFVSDHSDPSEPLSQ